MLRLDHLAGAAVGASLVDARHAHADPAVRLPPCPVPWHRYGVAMEAVLPLAQMTTEEKLRAMEALWADLTRHAEAFESPAWHADILRARDQRVAEGKETFENWDEAKRELRERLL